VGQRTCSEPISDSISLRFAHVENLGLPLWFVWARTLRRHQNFGNLVPPFIGDNDAPHGSSAPPQRCLYLLSFTSGSSIVWQKMAALVLNPPAVFKMEKIAWHTGTIRRPNKRS
jgi:hypothetical protein